MKKELIKQLDSQLSLAIRRLDGFRCFTCGNKGFEKDGFLDAGHLFTRSIMSLRFHPLNVFCQCRLCNLKHEEFPSIFIEKFKQMHGEELYEYLQVKRRFTMKQDGESMLEKLKIMNKLYPDYSKTLRGLKSLRESFCEYLGVDYGFQKQGQSKEGYRPDRDQDGKTVCRNDEKGSDSLQEIV